MGVSNGRKRGRGRGHGCMGVSMGVGAEIDRDRSPVQSKKNRYIITMKGHDVCEHGLGVGIRVGARGTWR